MSERGHADLFEVLVRQMRENGKVDFILSKALGVLPESELLKPVSNLLHRGSAPDYRASPARIGEFIPNGCSVGVEVGTCPQLGKVLA